VLKPVQEKNFVQAFCYNIVMIKVELLKDQCHMKAGRSYQLCTRDLKNHGAWIADDYGHVAFVNDDELGKEDDE